MFGAGGLEPNKFGRSGNVLHLGISGVGCMEGQGRDHRQQRSNHITPATSNLLPSTQINKLSGGTQGALAWLLGMA